MSACRIDGCDKPVKNKSEQLCAAHEHRLRRYGDPTFIPPARPIAKCKVDGCDGNVAGQGYCVKHYKRLRAHGDPLGGGIEYGAAQRFMESLSSSDTDECIPWPFGKTKDGYGRINWRGTTVGAHALSCELANGPKPSPKHEACHRCGNGHLGCVNPRHIYWGTRKENVADAISHGTAFDLRTVHKRGEAHPNAKFSDATVEEIRRRVIAGDRQVDLAAEFGMSQAHVSRIGLGESRTAAANDNAKIEAVA